MANEIVFSLNGERQTVGNLTDKNTTLNDYIRNHCNLKGTKWMCREGGCGVCTVSVTARNAITGQDEIFSVNSCLVQVFSCHGWSIKTIESLGSKAKGYHPIQTRLANFNATQCGFCTPGWIMNLQCVLESSNQKPTMKQLEDAFGGNLCRCTGYRPILDTIKSFASDATPSLFAQVKAIEDKVERSVCCNGSSGCGNLCKDEQEDFCVVGMEELSFTESKEVIKLNLPDLTWFKVYTLEQLRILTVNEKSLFSVISGNTARGVYPTLDLPPVIFDISGIDELRNHSLGTNLTLGSGMTLSKIMQVFKELSESNQYYRYLKEFYDHLNIVAQVQVRNIATIGGNLMIKHHHREFPSDIFLLFETVGAVLTIATTAGVKMTNIAIQTFLKMDMKTNIILSVSLPPLSSEYAVRTYKIMPRAQNAHAMINAGFVLKFASDSRTSVEKATVVYGGISEMFVHASATEKFLSGKNIFKNEVLGQALAVLNKELNPDSTPPETSPEHRKQLATNLFYKFILSIAPNSIINNRFISGGTKLTRLVSSGKQVYDTIKSEWPLNQPLKKIEANVQCSGEAQYINDIPAFPEQYYATFALSTIHKGTLRSIDASQALKVEGVVAFYTSRDIPGINTFTPTILDYSPDPEPVLAPLGGEIKYYSQPIAIIVARSEHAAAKAASMVKANYNKSNNAPVLTIQEALAAPKGDNRVVNNVEIPAKEKGTNVTKVIKGSLETHHQYHFHMETQITLCVPIEDGMDVYCATQWPDQVNVGISTFLNIPENSINLTVRRLGGGYGGKLSRATLIACACALAASKINKPIRFVLPLKMNMEIIGKKTPLLCNYEAGVNDEGEIQYLNNTFYQDNGSSHNETPADAFTLPSLPNGYESSRWYYSANSVLTDTPSNTWIRGPGGCEGVAMIETIMEHIALETHIDPIAVRKINYTKTDNPLPDLIDYLTKYADYETRKKTVEEFNNANRWRKKAISLVSMSFPFLYFGSYETIVSIYHGDGTVSVSHGGIEMGQGVNTKVAQVCAYILGIPIESVAIKPMNNLTSPNAYFSGGSVTSDAACYSTMKACQILLERLAPIKSTLSDPSWKNLIQAAYIGNIELTSTYMFSAKDDVQSHAIYGVCIAEVEIDVLTGNFTLDRVDMLEDTGESLNPLIDVGQCEGAFVLGLGYWTSEKIIFDPKTGENLTNRTWNYKVPGAQDIPVDFRVLFRRNAPNPYGVLRSKATGEPPLCMSVVVPHALRKAITAARAEEGINTKIWYDIDNPYTPERILLSSNINWKKFKLN